MAKEDSFMTNAKKRVAKTFGRTVTIAALSTALVGGVMGTGIASATGDGQPDLEQVADLPSNPGTPGSMYFFSSAAQGLVEPGHKVRVGAGWDAWKIWDEFQSQNQRKTTLNLAQDFIKVLGSTSIKVQLNGQECNTYATTNGGVKVDNGQQDGYRLDIVDVGGVVRQLLDFVAKVGDRLTASQFFSKLAGTGLVGYCDFIVPPQGGPKITVNGVVDTKNLGIIPTGHYEGSTFLTVDSQRAPNVPTIDGEYQLPVKEGGTITGTSDPGTLVQWKINGRVYSQPTATAGADGTYKLTLPADVKAGAVVPVAVQARKPGGGGVTLSEQHNLTVNPSLAKPVISDPTGDTVSAGQVIKVTGSEGAKVVPVDENGNPIGTAATITNGTAQVTLNKDLKPGVKIRIQASDATGSTPVYSDTKTVQADKPAPAQVYQTETPTAAPGQRANTTFAIQPENGDLLALAGKKVTVQAPEGFTFARSASGNPTATVAAGDKDDRNNGEYAGLGESGQVSADGKSLTLILPGAEELKRLIGDSNSIKIGVTVVAVADQTATAGEKSGGSVTVDGVGSADLKGRVK